MKHLTLILACVLGAGLAYGIDTEPAFDDPVLNERYLSLTREVRCLVCQNQTIADSNAPLASDLRREIREMIAAGQTDAEIAEFLVARYGDFVLYRPPLQPSTWALWGAPFLFLGLGVVIFARILKTRLGQPLDDAIDAAMDEATEEDAGT